MILVGAPGISVAIVGWLTERQDALFLFSVYSDCLIIRVCIRLGADRCRSVATSKMNFSSEVVYSLFCFW